MFANVSLELATTFAEAIGAESPAGKESEVTKSSPALSQLNTKKNPSTRKVGVIVGNEINGKEVSTVLKALKAKGIQAEVISDKLGKRKASDGTELKVMHTFLTASSVLFDAIYLAGVSADSKFKKNALHFINEAYAHYKPIGATHEGALLLKEAEIMDDTGVVSSDDTNDFTERFTDAIAAHRHWDRQII
jgi:catalase